MSRFYAQIQGNRGEATRMGTPNSGIFGHIRGWNLGASVSGYPALGGADTGRDEFEVRVTGGSNGHASSFGIAVVLEPEVGSSKREVRYFLPDGTMLACIEVESDRSYKMRKPLPSDDLA